MGVEIDGFDALEAKFQRLQEQGDRDAVYVVGTNVEYAIYLEFGTEDMPPYPFFRPAIAEFKRDPEGFILDETEYTSIDDIPTADELVQAIAFALERQMTKNASANGASDRSPGTHPEHPERDTGNLAASIQAKRVN